MTRGIQMVCVVLVPQLFMSGVSSAADRPSIWDHPLQTLVRMMDIPLQIAGTDPSSFVTDGLGTVIGVLCFAIWCFLHQEGRR